MTCTDVGDTWAAESGEKPLQPSSRRAPILPWGCDATVEPPDTEEALTRTNDPLVVSTYSNVKVLDPGTRHLGEANP